MSQFILSVPANSPLKVVGGGHSVKLLSVHYGAKGDSAYQVAVANGFVGTVTEWLASLRLPAVYAETIGNGVDQVFEVVHGLGTLDVFTEVYRNSGNYDTVLAEVWRSSVNAVTVVFIDPPVVDGFRVIVRG